MKYHYFHGRFTYSVKRSGLLYFVWVLPVRSRVGLILVLKRVRSRRCRVAVGGEGRRRSRVPSVIAADAARPPRELIP